MTENSGQEFMRRTYYSEMGESPQEGGVIPQPHLELPAPEGCELIQLTAAGELVIPGMELRHAIEERAPPRRRGSRFSCGK